MTAEIAANIIRDLLNTMREQADRLDGGVADPDDVAETLRFAAAHYEQVAERQKGGA